MSNTFKLTGGRELQAALLEMKRATAKAVGRRALKKAADPILDAYKAGTDRVSGDLIESEVVGTKLNRRQARMAKRLGKSAVEVHVGTNDPAGHLEEFGGGRQAPNPALTRAWEREGGQAAVDRIATELATEIEKTARRAARKAAKG